MSYAYVARNRAALYVLSQRASSANRKQVVVIETRLSQDQVLKLAILNHLQRPPFYVYAAACAALTAYTIVQGNLKLLLLAWVPFGLYLLIGLVGAVRGSRDPNASHFLPTRYAVSEQGLTITTPRGHREVPWTSFTKWKKMSDCYVLFLAHGPLLAIPQKSVPRENSEEFEALLDKQIR